MSCDRTDNIDIFESVVTMINWLTQIHEYVKTTWILYDPNPFICQKTLFVKVNFSVAFYNLPDTKLYLHVRGSLYCSSLQQLQPFKFWKR